MKPRTPFTSPSTNPKVGLLTEPLSWRCVLRVSNRDPNPQVTAQVEGTGEQRRSSGSLEARLRDLSITQTVGRGLGPILFRQADEVEVRLHRLGHRAEH